MSAEALESCKYTSEARQAGALSPLLSHIFFYTVDKMARVWEKERVIVFVCIHLGLLNEREQQCFS